MNQLGLNLATTYVFRSAEYNDKLEKRQVFLRSYQFCRKKSLTERIEGSLFRVKRVIWVRIKSAKKLRKLVWFRVRHGLFYFNRRRRRFFWRIQNGGHRGGGGGGNISWRSTSCFSSRSYY